MRILHILNEFDNNGNGIVNVCCDLACEQAKRENEVYVVSNGGEYVSLLEQSGGIHIFLNQKRTFSNILRMSFLFAKIIKNIKPDIVHAHMMTGTVLAYLLKRKGKYKIVTTVHNEWQKSCYIMKYADAVVGVSKAVQQSMIKKGAPGANTYCVFNGNLNSRRRMPINQIIPYELEHPNIITIGQLSHRKGSDLLFHAYEELAHSHPNLHLYYVGNADWKGLVSLIETSKFKDYVHLVGFEKEPLKYLISGDLFVLPSRVEPFGLVLIEARESGIPIIASNVGGIPEVLDQGRAGILFDNSNVEDLIKKIQYFMSSPDLKKELSQASKENLERFSVEKMTDEYDALYKKLLNA